MDSNLIYVKTTAGENAIQQRTRVIQRNVRMVLILVDGHSSVADLARKIGNLQLTEDALTELEKAGFIELKEEPSAMENQRVDQEIRASAIEKAIHSSRTENHGKFASDEPKNKASNAPTSPRSAFDAKDEIDEMEEAPVSRFSSLPTDLDMFEKSRSAADRHQEPEPEPEKPAHPRFPGASLLAQLKSLWAGAGRVLDDRPVKLKPIRRRTRNRGGTSWLAMFVFGFLGLLALGVATILLFPFGIYAPDLERAFSAAVARPVSLQKIHVDLYPEPALVLGKVQIGRNDDAIRIGEIRLHPDFKSLFSERRELRKVVVSGTQLQLERITGMPSIFAALAKPDDSPGIGFILLKNTDISFSGIALRNADAEIQRDSAGNMQALTARSADGSVILEARPTATAIDLAVEAYAWSFDADSRFVSDSLSFKGHLEKDTLMISGLEIRALDGLIQGDAIVHAGGAKPNLSGSVVFERINASRLSEALGIGRKLDGVIMGSVRFSANSDTWPAIFSSIDGEGEFSIQRGSLNGIDLAEAARRRVSGVPVQGGTTNFEQMSGKVRLGREKNQFYDLDISSGLMRSTGQIDIGMDGRLTGQLELQMKGSVNQTRVPVLVSGTLFAPTLQAGR